MKKRVENQFDCRKKNARKENEKEKDNEGLDSNMGGAEYI